MTQPRDFFMFGAGDVGGRAAATKRREQVAEGGPASDSPYVIDVTEATFNTDVVGKSQQVPVILDLWADWSEPCKQLSPLLEKLANEAAGAWILARVDVDANPQLSGQLFATFQAQSIPLVVAVVGGQLVGGFLGALPEAQLRSWISQILAVATQLGLPGGDGAAGADQANEPGAGPAQGAPLSPEDELLADPRFKAAQDAMDTGDLNGASNALDQVLAESPGHPVAKAWLAQIDLFRRVDSYDPAKVQRGGAERPDDVEA